MPEALLSALRKSFGFGRYDSMISGSLPQLQGFSVFPNPGGKALEYRPHPPINIPEIDDPASIFDVIRAARCAALLPLPPLRLHRGCAVNGGIGSLCLVDQDLLVSDCQ